jgi:hypothetical protein
MVTTRGVVGTVALSVGVAFGVGAGGFTALSGAVALFVVGPACVPPFGEVPGVGFGVGDGFGFVSLIVDTDVVVKTSASATALAGKTAYTEHTSKARSSLLRELTKDDGYSVSISVSVYMVPNLSPLGGNVTAG